MDDPRARSSASLSLSCYDCPIRRYFLELDDGELNRAMIVALRVSIVQLSLLTLELTFTCGVCVCSCISGDSFSRPMTLFGSVHAILETLITIG